MNPFVRALDARVGEVMGINPVFENMMKQRSALRWAGFVLVVLVAIGRSFLLPDPMKLLRSATTVEVIGHVLCFAVACAAYYVILCILTDVLFSAVIVNYVSSRVWVEAMRDLLVIALVAVEQRACAVPGYLDKLVAVMQMSDSSASNEHTQATMRWLFDRPRAKSASDRQIPGQGSISRGRSISARSIDPSANGGFGMTAATYQYLSKVTEQDSDDDSVESTKDSQERPQQP